MSGWLTVIQTEEVYSIHQRGWSVTAQVSVVFSGDLIKFPKQSQIYNSLSRKHGYSKYQVFTIIISIWTYFKNHQDKSIILIYKRKVYFTVFTHWGNQILQELSLWNMRWFYCLRRKIFTDFNINSESFTRFKKWIVDLNSYFRNVSQFKLIIL